MNKSVINKSAKNGLINSTYTIDPSQWLNRYHNYLIRYASSRLPTNMTEDFVQDTYLAGLKSMKTYKYKASEKTWLTSILRNKIIDYYRKANSKKGKLKKQCIRLSEDLDVFEHIDVASNYVEPDAELNVQELKEIILSGMKNLSPLEQNVLVLKRQSFQTKEVCQALNIKEVHCWVLICRARKRLREHLNANWFQ